METLCFSQSASTIFIDHFKNMKTILYMGITPNGYIAKEDGDSQWTSEENLKGFFELSKRVGNIVMGRATYMEALRYGYFPFPDALNVVLSSTSIENAWGEDHVLVTDKTPEEVLSTLAQKGFDTAFLAGGGKVNASFFEKNLIDEIYFDVEPLLFGKGIPVIAESTFACELKLLETKQLNADTVQLHYLVKHPQ